MKRLIVVALLVLLGGLVAGPAWAYWGGDLSIDDPIDALVTIQVLPLHAEIWIDDTRIGTALEVSNRGIAVFGNRIYIVSITAPGFRPRRLALVPNVRMPQRIYVDLVSTALDSRQLR